MGEVKVLQTGESGFATTRFDALLAWARKYSLFRELGWFGFVEMLSFLVVLTITLVYAWRKGALEWEK